MLWLGVGIGHPYFVHAGIRLRPLSVLPGSRNHLLVCGRTHWSDPLDAHISGYPFNRGTRPLTPGADSGPTEEPGCPSGITQTVLLPTRNQTCNLPIASSMP